MSLETSIARIQAIETAFAPPAAPPPAATQDQSGSSFSATLQSAMGASAAPVSAPAAAAAPGHYPHLDGDLDSKPELLQRLEALAASRGMHFHITSGLRTYAEQERLWASRGSNPFPVARPGTSRHESGNAADVLIGGRPIQTVFSASELRAAGLSPLAGDAVHVELPAA